MSIARLDAALADAARGDEAAIACLYRELNPRLLRYLRHHVGPVAEDVASDVWLGLASQLSDFDGTFASFRALMFAVARRRVIDRYRRDGSRVALVSLDAAFDRADAIDAETEAVEHLTAQAAVEALTRALPAEQAEIVLLRVLGELDVAEVAAIVGKSEGAVRIAQHRAFQRLQRRFDRNVVTR